MMGTLPFAEPTATGRLAPKWKVLISVIFGIFMVILDTTVVNVAFQTLRAEYGATLNDSQWIISIYVLMLGISTPLAGFFLGALRHEADLFNRHRHFCDRFIAMRPRAEFAIPDRRARFARFRRRHLHTVEHRVSVANISAV
jgi:hypothetical protein